MFLPLLIVTFLISIAVATVVALLFRPALSKILERILADSIYTDWVT